jgi:hypothetical protein
MKKVTHLKIAPIALVVLMVLLTLPVAKRKDLTAEEAEDDALRTVVKLGDTGIRNEDAAVAFLALMLLFAFVMWTALRASDGKTNMPPAGDTTAKDPAPRVAQDAKLGT